MKTQAKDGEELNTARYRIQDDGERFVPWTNDYLTSYEHVHRYLLACQYASNRRVLDIACGEGYGTAMLAKTARAVVGADIDPTTVDHARQHHAAANTSFVRADAEQLALEPESFDLVVSYETIEHIEAHEAFLEQVRRALTPAGMLIISTPNRRTYTDDPSYCNPYHKRELYLNEFVTLLNRHFEHVQVLGQDVVGGSFITSTHGDDFLREGESCALTLTEFNRDQLEYAPVPRGSGEPRYYIAVCSDVPLPPPSSALMVDTRHMMRQQLEAAWDQTRARDEQLEAAYATLKDRDEQLEAAYATLKDRDEQLEAVYATVRARDEQLEAAYATLKDRDEQLEAARGRIQEMDDNIKELQHWADLGEIYRRQLIEVTTSKAYKLVTHVVWPISRLMRGKRTPRQHVATGSGVDSSPSPDELQVGLDRELENSFVVGPGNVLKLSGWCYHPRQRIRSLDVVVEGVTSPVTIWSFVKPEVLKVQAPAIDRTGNSLNSGFCVLIPFSRVDQPRRAQMALRATLADGSRREAGLGSIELLPRESRARDLAFPDMSAEPTEPRIAICMATYNPPLDLFEQQIDSIIAQSHRNWICIVNDDGSKPALYAGMRRILAKDTRFHLFQNAVRRNFYHNFEAAMELVPPAAQFVGLCDQDDLWYPDKLRATLSAFTPDTMLVYTDLDVVSREGELIHHSYWVGRRNNYTHYKSLLFANTVTGAASLFRAELLCNVLPLPSRVGDSFHDHWLACVAMTRGRLGYIDKPMYAYRQHANNVIGHHKGRLSSINLSALSRTLRSPGRMKSSVTTALWHKRDVYFNDVLRLALIAKTLQLRVDKISPPRRQALREFSGFGSSIPALLRESVASLMQRRVTLGAEWYCARGALSNRMLNAYYQRKSRAIYEHHVATLAGETAAAAPNAKADPTSRGPVRAASLGNVEAVQQKIAPLRLEVSDREPVRANLIVPSIDFRYLFGGYIGKLNLALQLQKSGYAVRLVIVDWCDYNPTLWRHQIRGYQDLAGFFDKIEVTYQFDRETPLRVSPNDRFIATTWWTAHIADRAVGDLGKDRFVYLIQEYEPITFPMGSFYALASETYTFPHYALFSTELLREYFKLHRIGVFAESIKEGERNSISFKNAINTFVVDPTALRERKKKKLLFYARPEEHAARNMYEIGVCALQEVFAEGLYDPSEWELYGIGTVANATTLKMAHGRELKLLPRLDLDDYVALLPSFDVGLSLMLTPHPSLVPLEMAAAGMLTVTNTCENKTREAVEALSSNLIATPPTIRGVAQGLRNASRFAGDIDARVAGSHVRWSTDWDDALGGDVMDRLKCYLGTPPAALASVSLTRARS